MLSREVVAFRRAGEWIVAVESPGAIGSPGSMPDCTTTVSLIWTARGRSWIRYMTGDALVAGFDPQRPDQRVGTEPGFLDEYVSGLPLPFPPAGDPAAQLPVMLAIAERLTGLAFAPQWLDEPHVLVSIRTPLTVLRGEAGAARILDCGG